MCVIDVDETAVVHNWQDTSEPVTTTWLLRITIFEIYVLRLV